MYFPTSYYHWPSSESFHYDHQEAVWFPRTRTRSLTLLIGSLILNTFCCPHLSNPRVLIICMFICLFTDRVLLYSPSWVEQAGLQLIQTLECRDEGCGYHAWNTAKTTSFQTSSYIWQGLYYVLHAINTGQVRLSRSQEQLKRYRLLGVGRTWTEHPALR